MAIRIDWDRVLRQSRLGKELSLGFHGEGASRHQPRRSVLPGLRRSHAEAHRQFRSVLGLRPVSMLPGDAEKTRIWLRQMIEPARGFDFISFPRYCQTPVLHQTHTKPPKPRPGGSYFAWWFKCPACQTVYLVEAARRFFDATGTAEPLSAPDCSADWVTRERAILPC